MRPAAVPPVRRRYGTFAFACSRWRPRSSILAVIPETIRSLADLVAARGAEDRAELLLVPQRQAQDGAAPQFRADRDQDRQMVGQGAAGTDRGAAGDPARRSIPKNTGMTARNRARLRQFDDPENLRRLIDLPEAILRALPRDRVA